MKTRQPKDVPSEYEESEQGTHNSNDSESSEYEATSEKDSSVNDEESDEESNQLQVADTSVTAIVPRPLDAILHVIFHLTPPKYMLLNVFSSQQLSQLGLQKFAQADLFARTVSTAKLSALLLTFLKFNDKVLTMDYLAQSMGMANIATPPTDSRTYAALSPTDIVRECEQLLSKSHPDYTQNQQIFSLLHYYFLLRTPVAGANTLPSPTLNDMYFCLCKGMPFSFHATILKSLRDRAKRFRSQRKGKANTFNCYATPIMYWVVRIISEMPTASTPLTKAGDTSKRQGSSGVQTRGGHTKQAKVIRCSPTSLSSLPFFESHAAQVIPPTRSSQASLPPISPSSTSPSLQQSAPVTLPPLPTPIGTVTHSQSTMVHNVPFTPTTEIPSHPSTSNTRVPSCTQKDDCPPLLSGEHGCLAMDRRAIQIIEENLHLLKGANKMHLASFESMYQEILVGHQRVFERDVEKVAVTERNRMLSRQVKDLKEVINSLHIQLQEAKDELHNKSISPTLCARCLQSQPTDTTAAPVALLLKPFPPKTYTPRLTPDCTALTPQSCTVVPVVDSSGEYAYDTYLEECNSHSCTLMTPSSTSYSWTDTSPPYATSTIEAWFCSSSMISYRARVEINTGLPPGKKEDRFAKCHYDRMADLLTFMNCRDRTFWKCSDCLQAYKYWICAIAFPQCTTSPPLHASTVGPYDVEHAIYGTKLNPTIHVNYTIIKPCRGVCFDVHRKCPYAVDFHCPYKDTRDYHDYPDCNLAGNLAAMSG
ncbi:hypothetical protein L7F22_023135 [Adiantum nelumboides]|nr:hypothetical protein [Adiantum nelumboides]